MKNNSYLLTLPKLFPFSLSLFNMFHSSITVKNIGSKGRWIGLCNNANSHFWLPHYEAIKLSTTIFVAVPADETPFSGVKPQKSLPLLHRYPHSRLAGEMLDASLPCAVAVPKRKEGKRSAVTEEWGRVDGGRESEGR